MPQTSRLEVGGDGKLRYRKLRLPAVEMESREIGSLEKSSRTQDHGRGEIDNLFCFGPLSGPTDAARVPWYLKGIRGQHIYGSHFSDLVPMAVCDFHHHDSLIPRYQVGSYRAP